MASWRSPLNAVAFGLRAALRFRRGVPQLRDETKSNLFDYLEAEVADTNGRTHAERRATELAQRYGLAPLKRASTRLDYCDNLYLLDALETLPETTCCHAQTSSAPSTWVRRIGATSSASSVF